MKRTIPTMKEHVRKAILAGEFDEAIVELLKNAEPSEEAKQYNDEVLENKDSKE